MKTVFTVLAPESSIDTLDSIAAFSATNDAQLRVIVLSEAVAVPGTVFPGVPTYGNTAEYATAVNQTLLRAKELEKRLMERGVSFDVIPVSQPVTGIDNSVWMRALYADLAILPANTGLTKHLYNNILEATLFNAGIPTMVLPAEWSRQLSVSRLLVGWCPTAQAARAIRESVHWLNAGCDVQIVMVNNSKSTDDMSSSDELAAFLSRKGLNVKINNKLGKKNSIANALSQVAVELSADLLAIGAYGHSRTRELLFGGTTQALLENPPCPLLLSH